jgi:hypothetical protein
LSFALTGLRLDISVIMFLFTMAETDGSERLPLITIPAQ